MNTENPQDLPAMHPDELAELRRVTGNPDLTNDEAHAYLRKQKVEGAFYSWLEEKEGRQ